MSESFEEKVSDLVVDLIRQRDEAREAAAKWEAIALREASINGSRLLSIQHSEELNPRFEINPETSKWYRVNS